MEVQIPEAELDCLVYVYEKNPIEDLLITQWWHRMGLDGDILNTFTREGQALGGLFSIVRSSTFVYSLDDTNEIWWASWVQPLLNAVSLGIWCRKDCRGTWRNFSLSLAFYRRLLALHETILGVTGQEDKLKLHTKLGYSIIEAPGIWDGQRGWIVVLSRDTFNDSFLEKIIKRKKGEKNG